VFIVSHFQKEVPPADFSDVPFELHNVCLLNHMFQSRRLAVGGGLHVGGR
jgi:hypothetical protein